MSIKNILVTAAANLSLIAYTDQGGSGNQTKDIIDALQAIPPTSNGPYELKWGPANTGALLSYVAKGADESYTVAFRGTANMSDPEAFLIDWVDNLWIYETVPWNYPASAGAKVSKGMSSAFESIIATPDPSTNLLLLDFFLKQPDTLKADIYTTGHSLGGALANLVAVWLSNQLDRAVVPYTYAAPTVTDPNFSTLFASLCPVSYQCVNIFDMIPKAWSTLEYALALYYPNPWIFNYGPDQLVAATVAGVSLLVYGMYETLVGTWYSFLGPFPWSSNDFPTEVLTQHSIAAVYLPSCVVP